MQTLNLYYKIPKAQLSEVSQTTEKISVIQRHRKVTRLYIILFILVLVVIIRFTGLNLQMHSVTVNSPTELIFEQLKNKYSSSLSCTCSKVAIPYSKFLSITITAHHQIC
ncbi:unnamed protein product [Rotaria sp. Silwood2]|nr:unnamed protein product [Rotaria sp. Silwood2]CAF4234177.1 unnamed protein product [Rotaria sp. Silwood2]